MRKELLTEAAIVGVSTVIAGYALSKAMTPGRPVFWFALGVATHLGWEAVGGNRWYVETRDPKDFPKGLLGG